MRHPAAARWRHRPQWRQQGSRHPWTRTERGDVPGWVLITVMTAALVAGLLAIAGPELNQMLREALASVG
jgi:hypothetical protein